MCGNLNKTIEVVTLNENNLIPNSKRSPSEVRENGAKGGRKSGETRRRKKSMREKMKLLLSLPACDSDMDQLQAIGVDTEDSDNEMVILKGLFLKAAEGDVQAVREIRNILGKDNSSEELVLKKKELKLKESAMRSDKAESQETPMLYKALEDDQ